MIYRNIAVMVAALFTASLAQAADGPIDWRVRDGETHYSVQASIHVAGPVVLDLHADATGRIEASLPAGSYQITVSARGYKDMKDHKTISQAGNRNTYMLDPNEPPLEARAEVLGPKLRAGYTLISGYVVDSETGRPTRGATVRLMGAGQETMTDARGYYSLSVPTPLVINDLPGTDTISVEMPGYKTMVNKGMIIYGEDGGGYFFELERGNGKIERDVTHKLMRRGSAKGMFMLPCELVGARHWRLASAIEHQHADERFLL